MTPGLKEELDEVEKIMGQHLTGDQVMELAVLFNKLIDRGVAMEQHGVTMDFGNRQKTKKGGRGF